MIFITGGSYQGKLDFALDHFQADKGDVYICTADSPYVDDSKKFIASWDQHILALLRSGTDIPAYTADLLRSGKLKDKILIGTDISCGLVPMEEKSRRWREETGRAYTALCAQAQEVWRVFCGIGVRIK